MNTEPDAEPGLDDEDRRGEEPSDRRAGPNDRRHYTVLERIWLWVRRDGGYQNLWLIAITAIVLYALSLNGDRVDDNRNALTAIQTSRIAQTETACSKTNEVIGGVNNLATAIQSIVLAGAILPGDQAQPKGVPPSEWTGIKPGPFSQQLHRQFPGLPTAEERLTLAKANARTIEDAKSSARDCAAQVRAIRDSLAQNPDPNG